MNVLLLLINVTTDTTLGAGGGSGTNSRYPYQNNIMFPGRRRCSKLDEYSQLLSATCKLVFAALMQTTTLRHLAHETGSSSISSRTGSGRRRQCRSDHKIFCSSRIRHRRCRLTSVGWTGCQPAWSACLPSSRRTTMMGHGRGRIDPLERSRF